MIQTISVCALLAMWVAAIATAILLSLQHPAEQKNRIPNPYQDSRALQFGSKPGATYRP